MSHDQIVRVERSAYTSSDNAPVRTRVWPRETKRSKGLNFTADSIGSH